MDDKLRESAREFGIGIGHDPTRKSPWFMRVDGKKRWLRDEASLDDAVKRRMKSVKAFGIKRAEVTPADALVVADLKARLNGTGYSLAEVFERGMASIQASPLKQTFVKDSIEHFIAQQDHRARSGHITKGAARTCRFVLRRFKTACGHRLVRETTKQHIREYLTTSGYAPTTVETHRRIIIQLFNWCVDEGMCERAPKVKGERIVRNPAIFTPTQVKEVFRVACERFDSLVPILALQWFAGMRPSTTLALTWDCLDFEHRTIMVPAHINKFREPQIIEDLPPDQLWTWLRPYRKEAGRISPPNAEDMLTDLHVALGYGGEDHPWPVDVARHSFGSYLVPVYRSLDRVARVMLHHGTYVLIRHYQSKNVRREDGEAYFKLLPGQL